MKSILGRAVGRATDLFESLESRTMLAADTAPTAKLSVTPITSWTSNYTFKVTYTDDKSVRTATIDNNDLTITGPNGFSRVARWVSTTGSGKSVVARYKISSPDGLWEATDNGTYTVKLNGNQISDTKGHITPAASLGSFKVGVSDFPSNISNSNNAVPAWAVNVKDFGAVPNDGVDDTVAIQNAINSLPDYSVGAPMGSALIGGIVYLPAGTYTLSHPLMLDSGIVLLGAGTTTVLSNKSTSADDSVIRFHSRQTHGFVSEAGVENLAITTTVAKGIDASSTDGGDLVHLQMSDLTISSGGTAIDLHTRDVYGTSFDRITVNNPGSGALWVTIAKSDGNAAVNSITNFNITGTARAGFVAPNAMVFLNGDFNVNGLAISDIGAEVLPLYAQKLVTFRSLSINTSTDNLSDGVVAQFSNASNIDIDAMSNLGNGRVLALSDAHTVHIGTLTLASNALLKYVATFAGSSHLVTDTVQTGSNGRVGALDGLDPTQISVRSVVMSSGTTGASNVGSNYNGSSGSISISNPIAISPLSVVVADAGAFGATGNDSSDDTAAIQRAIDSLPTGDGMSTSGSNIVGGAVLLPVGRLFISQALRLPSGVWLEGRGSATQLYDTDTNAADSTILIVPGKAAGYNIGAGVENLGLYTVSAAAIRADASINNGLIDLRLLNLDINAGGDSIDLRAAKTYHSLIQNINFADSGSLDLWVGDDAEYSSDNTVRNIYVVGGNRSNYVADRAMFVFEGQTVVENFWPEQARAVATPIFASGNITIRGLWMEYSLSALPANKDVIDLENCTSAYIDRVEFIDNDHHLKVANSQNVKIGWLDIAGQYDTLSQVLDLDSVSKVTLGTVNSIRDAGSLDDSRLTINGNFDQTATDYVDTLAMRSGTNLVNDISTWVIGWGDQYGAITGSVSITQTASGPKMTINVTSNPNNRSLSVRIGTHVPAASIGKRAVAAWRIDGPGQAIVYTYDFVNQYSARAMGSETASNLPGVLTGADFLYLQLGTAVGTFVISDVSLAAVS